MTEFEKAFLEAVGYRAFSVCVGEEPEEGVEFLITHDERIPEGCWLPPVGTKGQCWLLRHGSSTAVPAEYFHDSFDDLFVYPQGWPDSRRLLALDDILEPRN